MNKINRIDCDPLERHNRLKEQIEVKPLETLGVDFNIDQRFSVYIDLIEDKILAGDEESLAKVEEQLRGKIVAYSDLVSDEGLGVYTGENLWDLVYIDDMIIPGVGIANLVPIKNVPEVIFSQDSDLGRRVVEKIEHDPRFKVETYGRSCFAARNSIRISGDGIPLKRVEVAKILYADTRSGRPGYEEAMLKLGGDDIYTFPGVKVDKHFDISTEEVDIFDHSLINAIISECRKEMHLEKVEKLLEEFAKNTQDGGILSWVEVGGSTGLKTSDLPQSWEVVLKDRIANTRDHRQNRDHTYRVYVVDRSKIRQSQKTLTLSIPEELKGLFIGKGGYHIKEVQAALGVQRIILK